MTSTKDSVADKGRQAAGRNGPSEWMTQSRHFSETACFNIAEDISTRVIFFSALIYRFFYREDIF